MNLLRSMAIVVVLFHLHFLSFSCLPAGRFQSPVYESKKLRKEVVRLPSINGDREEGGNYNTDQGFHSDFWATLSTRFYWVREAHTKNWRQRSSRIEISLCVWHPEVPPERSCVFLEISRDFRCFLKSETVQRNRRQAADTPEEIIIIRLCCCCILRRLHWTRNNAQQWPTHFWERLQSAEKNASATPTDQTQTAGRNKIPEWTLESKPRRERREGGTIFLLLRFSMNHLSHFTLNYEDAQRFFFLLHHSPHTWCSTCSKPLF